MSGDGPRRVLFVCQHGAFRSRMAAAYFNAVAPPGWMATSAGLTPQSEVSTRLGPLLAGTEAERFVDPSPPRSVNGIAAAKTISIDVDVDIPGAQKWASEADGAEGSDEDTRDWLHARVRHLVRELTNGSAV